MILYGKINFLKYFHKTHSKNPKNIDEIKGLQATKIFILNTDHHPTNQNTPLKQAKKINKNGTFFWGGGVGQISTQRF